MIVIAPERVTFAGSTWGAVTSLTVDFEPQRLVEAWGDDGPWCLLADVPERRCIIKLVRRLEGLSADAPPGASAGLWESPRPGDQGLLSFGATTNRADRGGVIVRTTAMVRSVRHRLERGRAEQVIELLALAGSSGGGADPFAVEPAGPGGLQA